MYIHYFFSLPIRIIRFTHIGRSQKSHALNGLCTYELRILCSLRYFFFFGALFFLVLLWLGCIFTIVSANVFVSSSPRNELFELFYIYLDLLFIICGFRNSKSIYGWFGWDSCWRNSLLLCIIQTYEYSITLIITHKYDTITKMRSPEKFISVHMNRQKKKMHKSLNFIFFFTQFISLTILFRAWAIGNVSFWICSHCH